MNGVAVLVAKLVGTLLLDRLPIYNLSGVVANMKRAKSFVDVAALMACHAPIVCENAITCDGTNVLLPTRCLQVVYIVVFKNMAP